MAATSFPSFLELPVELQMQVWEAAIEKNVEEYPEYQKRKTLKAFFDTKIWNGKRGLQPVYGFFKDGVTPPPWYGPRSGELIYVHKNWHRVCWPNLFNACSMSRLLTLRWMRKQIELDEEDRGHRKERKQRILGVFTEMIDELDARLRGQEDCALVQKVACRSSTPSLPLATHTTYTSCNEDPYHLA